MNAEYGKDEPTFSDSDFEQRLRQSLHAAKVPPGLRSRLNQRIRDEAGWKLDQPDVEAGEHVAAHSSILMDAMASGAVAASESIATEPSDRDSDSLARPAQTDSMPEVAAIRRRWQTSAIVLSSALALLLMLGWSWLGRSAAPQMLASHCVHELENLGPLEAPQALPEFPAHVKQFVSQHLSLSQPSLDGQQLCESGKFGSAAQVWKLSDRRGAVYVFVFADPPPVSGLTSQLRVIRDSGPLSLAALSTGEHLFVVATAGDVRQFFRTASFA